jgi:Galactosyltransferase
VKHQFTSIDVDHRSSALSQDFVKKIFEIKIPLFCKMLNRFHLLIVAALIATIAVQHNSSEAIIQSSLQDKNGTIGIPRKTTFLLGIFSTFDEFKKREIIRKTMFGMDLPTESRNCLCNLNEFLNSTHNMAHCQIIYTFVIGGGAHEKALLNPQHQLIAENNQSEADLTVLNIQENMNDGKTPSWFLFVSTVMGSRIDYVSKLDSDTFVSIPQLLLIIENDLPNRAKVPKPKVFGGNLMDFNDCGGNAKRRERCLPIRGKFYMAGQFYFISHDIVQLTHLWIDPTNHPDEDINFAYRIWKVNSSFTTLIYNDYLFWQHDLKSCEQFEEFSESVKNKSWRILEM